MVNLITRVVSIEIVCRQCGEWYFLWRFYSKVSLEIVWGLHGENLHKCIIHYTVSILSPYYLHHFYILLRRNMFPVSLVKDYCS